MDDNQKRKERKLKHCYQCNRLEDQLWAMAYEQVWPLIRKALRQKQAEQKRTAHQATATLTRMVSGDSFHG